MSGIRPSWWPWLVFGGAVAAVVYFDFASTLPFSDEWFYRWSVRGVVAGHGLHPWPGAIPPALVQLGAASIVALLGLGESSWRLTVIPFLALQAWFGYRVARELGAGQTWASVAAVVLPASPLELNVATGLMSDVAYLGLLMAAAFFGIRWLRDGRGLPWLLVATGLAGLQRQGALGIPLAIIVSLAATAEGRRRLRQAGAPVAGLCLVCIAALAAPTLLGLGTPALRGTATTRVLGQLPAHAVGTLLVAPVMLAFLALPLAGVLLRRSDSDRHRYRGSLVIVVLADAALVAAVVFQFGFGTMIFPGDALGPWGLGQLHLPGAKPNVLPVPLLLVLEVTVVANLLLLLPWRRGLWEPLAGGEPELFLMLLGISQLAPMLVTGEADRYHLAVAAPLVPLLVVRACRGAVPRLAPAFAIAVLALGVAAYVVGEQDFEAWQHARSAAAEDAYQLGRAAGFPNPFTVVDSGYEPEGELVQVPAYDNRHVLLDPWPDAVPHPVWRLELAPAGDPRPGRDYRSIAPGRVVIVRVDTPPAG